MCIYRCTYCIWRYMYIYISLYIYIYIFVCIYTYDICTIQPHDIYLYTHTYFVYILFLQDSINHWMHFFFRNNLTHTWQVSTCRWWHRPGTSFVCRELPMILPKWLKSERWSILKFFFFFSRLIQDMELPRLGQFLALFSSQECQMDFGSKWSFELPYFFFHFNARTWIW